MTVIGLMPTGYTSSLLATFMSAEGVTPSNVRALEAPQPSGSMMCLQVNLSSRPDNIGDIASELSQALTDAGVRSWLTEPAVADPVEPYLYITWINEGKGDVVAEQWQSFLLTTPGLILIGVVAIMFMFLIVPGFAELIETVISLAMMAVMMYFMVQVAAMIRPELKPLAEKEKELVRRAREGAPEAISQIKSLASKGISWAEKALREIKGP